MTIQMISLGQKRPRLRQLLLNRINNHRGSLGTQAMRTFQQVSKQRLRKSWEVSLMIVVTTMMHSSLVKNPCRAHSQRKIISWMTTKKAMGSFQRKSQTLQSLQLRQKRLRLTIAMRAIKVLNQPKNPLHSRLRPRRNLSSMTRIVTRLLVPPKNQQHSQPPRTDRQQSKTNFWIVTKMKTKNQPSKSQQLSQSLRLNQLLKRS